MSKALVIYHDGKDDIKLFAEKIRSRLEDLGMNVTITEDNRFKDFNSVHEYDVIALGAPCLSCRKCHGAQECRAPKKLRRDLKKLFAMNLQDKKLITFAQSTDPEKHEWVRRRIESLIAPTKTKLVASIGCIGTLTADLDIFLKTSVNERVIS